MAFSSMAIEAPNRDRNIEPQILPATSPPGSFGDGPRVDRIDLALAGLLSDQRNQAVGQTAAPIEVFVAAVEFVVCNDFVALGQ